MLEVDAADLEWGKGRWYVRSEGQLDTTCVYNPPNLTCPYGAYICVVDVDPGTGKVAVRRFVAVDDCGCGSTR